MHRSVALLAGLLAVAAAPAADDDRRGYGFFVRPAIILTESHTLSFGVSTGWNRPFEFVDEQGSKGLHPNIDLTFALNDGLTRINAGFTGYLSGDSVGAWRTAWIYGAQVETDQRFGNPVLQGHFGYEALVVPPGTGGGIAAARDSVAVIDLQALTEFGYKTNTYVSPNDTSAEPPDTYIWRLKAGIDVKLRPRTSWLPIVAQAQAAGWYDIRNDAFYHLLDVGVRARLGNWLYWDIYRYQNGWGAPTFNTGDQHNWGFTWRF